jgi:hypothetical protein
MTETISTNRRHSPAADREYESSKRVRVNKRLTLWLTPAEVGELRAAAIDRETLGLTIRRLLGRQLSAPGRKK